MLQELGGSTVIGPILVGLEKSVQIVSIGAKDSDIVNMAAIAAYNAGPNSATRWLPDAPHEAPVWVENIPYNETRDYVQRVLWHSLVFAWKRSGEAQKADAWTAPVTLPNAAPPAAPAPNAAPPG